MIIIIIINLTTYNNNRYLKRMQLLSDPVWSKVQVRIPLGGELTQLLLTSCPVECDYEDAKLCLSLEQQREWESKHLLLSQKAVAEHNKNNLKLLNTNTNSTNLNLNLKSIKNRIEEDDDDLPDLTSDLKSLEKTLDIDNSETVKNFSSSFLSGSSSSGSSSIPLEAQAAAPNKNPQYYNNNTILNPLNIGSTI